MKIGFIGLGIMGCRMAANLQRHGNELVIYNRTPDKAATLLERGAQWAESPAVVAAQVDILFTMLATPAAVQATALNEQGLLDALEPGSLWVDCSTVNPSFTRQMAEQARRRQIRFLDAPVAGSKVPAEQAQLLFLVGGEAADIEVCQPLFQAMGRQVIHVGGHGQGTALKMVFNLLLGETMLAFVEALTLGQSAGIALDTLLEALLNAPLASPVLKAKRTLFETGDFAPEFPLQWMRKDLQLASTTAYENGIALPAVNLAKEIYGLAERQGLGPQDFAAVYRWLRQSQE
ncbi:MAG: NAD(P)-dependent oxidoreductase [Candidatus Competibacteraceae bacterium]